MSDALGAAISGLKVSQRSLDVISTNVSNSSTVGYTRKILPQETIIIGGEGVGVLSGSIYRNVDENLIVAEQNQTAEASYYSTKANYLNNIMQFHSSSDSLKAISTKIMNLEQSFINLSSAPSSREYLSSVVSSAQLVADEFNNYGEMLNDLRNQTESDLVSSVNEVNNALEIIAKLNSEITKLSSGNSGIATLEDQRDAAMKTISEYLDVNSYMEGDKLIVITKQGAALVDSEPHPLIFNASSASTAKFYPSTLNGLYVDGEEITGHDLGGKISALFELRDEILPQYEAQIDELAQKLSYRFQTSGVQLFNDQYGSVPDNSTPPVLTGYSGYASVMKVNDAIVNDTSLLRHGTTGNTENEGSIEVIRRVIEFTFGTYMMQTATGSTDINGMANIVPTLGVTTHTRITGDTNIAAVASFADLTNAADLLPAGADFDITLEGAGTQTITVTQADDAQSLIAKINTAFGASKATINIDGAIAFDHDGDITLATNAAGPSTNGLSAAVFTELGHSFGTTTKPNATFTVQLGTREEVTIEVLPTDDDTDLLAKLNAVDGLTATLDGATGALILTPDDGGDLEIRDTSGDLLDLLGIKINNIEHEAFRSDQVGPNPAANMETGLISKSSITEYANSIISNQAETASILEARAEQEQDYLAVLENRNLSISGVNIDEEMADLIRIQANYSAAAKMIANIIEMFDELMAAFR